MFVGKGGDTSEPKRARKVHHRHAHIESEERPIFGRPKFSVVEHLSG